MSSSAIRDDKDSLADDEQQQGLLQDEQPASGMGSDSVKSEGRKGDGLAYIVIWTAYAVFALTSWFTVLSNDPASLGWFKYHPLLQSLSIGLFTYGILTLQPTSQPQTKAAGLQRHQVAMFGLGIPAILLGATSIFLQKASHDAPHFTSTHGKLGLITIVWLLVQAVFGGTTVWSGGAAWGGGMRPKLMWKYHRLSGYVVFPLLLFTTYLGGCSTWIVGNTGPFLQLLAYPFALLAILAGVYTRIRPSKIRIFA